MRTSHLILTFVLVATLVISLVILINPKSDTVPMTPDVTATSTEQITVPSPLTLASLQAMPGWNPTMAVEGMVRMEDGFPQLSNSKLLTEQIQIMTLGPNGSFFLEPSGFTIKHADSYYDYSPQNKNCRYYPSSGTTTPLRDCVNTPIPDINELIIISDDTGEVLHKFKLEEGFSLAGFRWNMYEIKAVVLNNNLDGDFNLPISIYKWNDLGDEDPYVRYSYELNLLTGELK